MRTQCILCNPIVTLLCSRVVLMLSDARYTLHASVLHSNAYFIIFLHKYYEPNFNRVQQNWNEMLIKLLYWINWINHTNCKCVNQNVIQKSSGNVKVYLLYRHVTDAFNTGLDDKDCNVTLSWELNFGWNFGAWKAINLTKMMKIMDMM